MTEWARVAWPLARLDEGLAALAHRCGLASPPIPPPRPPADIAWDGALINQWVKSLAAWLAIEAEAVETPFDEVDALVQRAAPALLRLPAVGEDPPLFVALLRGGRCTATLLAPDGSEPRVSVTVLATAMRAPLIAPHTVEVERMLDLAGVMGRRRDRARAAILRERLAQTRVGGTWLLRRPPGSSFWGQVRDGGLVPYLVYFVTAHLLYYMLWLALWAILGRAVFGGVFNGGWMVAWGLLLLTLLPLRLIATWAQGIFSVRMGTLLKQRLLLGAMRLEPDEVRHQGIGQFLARVVESDALESFALSGGFASLMGLIELALAAGILLVGAGGWGHALLLGAWVGAMLALMARFLRQRWRWNDQRLEMTNDLVEQMVGQRTRVAQAARAHWHDEEDQALARYLDLSVAIDRTAALLQTLVPRGWLLLGLLALAPAFLAGASPVALAVGVGGTLLAFQGLTRLTSGISSLGGAWIAWQQAAPLFHAAARVPPSTPPDVALRRARATPDADCPLLDAQGLRFRYRRQNEPVVHNCTVQVHRGDRLLLEGPSGGGKSTLVALLAGLRHPEAGLLLLDGLDWTTLGHDGWRRHVAIAPQFHENHVFTGTFAFNLLMGRRWPPHPTDGAVAETLCHELGLAPLLARMPGGLQQMVGETGWQLSHGEKSRLFLARALLQEADLVVLDESFAALDPETLHRTLRCALERARTLLVITHP